MAKKINLLADTPEASSKALNLSEKLRKASVYGFLFFVLMVFGFVGVALFLNDKQQDSVVIRDVLTKRIGELQEVEQKLILIKDRAQKVSAISPQDDAVGLLVELEEISREYEADSGSLFTSSIVTPEQIEVSFPLYGANSLTKLLGRLKQSEFFTKIEMQSLRYLPGSPDNSVKLVLTK